MADVFQYRECRATITARIPDTPDTDAHPDRVLVQGRGTAHPQFQGGSVVFTEIGEYAIPQPIPVVIVDGELLVEVLSGDESVEVQPLYLPVTVDERANQNWSWRLTFDFLTLGEYGEEVSHPPLSFPVEAGDGPLEISTVATPVIKSSGFVTRGAPGAGLQEITAANGEIVFQWDNGRSTTIDVPAAVPGPQGVPGPEGPPGSVELTGVVPEISVGTNSVNVGGRDVLLLTHYAPYVRETLSADVDLNSLTSPADNGFWIIGSANSNPNMPAAPGVAGKLAVENSAFDRKQTLTFRSGGGTYERVGAGTTWREWQRIDSAFTPNGAVPSGTALATLRTRPNAGMWTVPSTSTYPDLPEVSGTRQPAGLAVFTTGLGDTIQIITFRFNQGVFWRAETSVGTFTDWTPLAADTSAIESEIQAVEEQNARLHTALDAVRMGTSPSTTFEQTAIFTSYDHGEAYMDWLAHQFPTKITILNLGASRQGRPIRAFQMGDPTKPTFYIMASQHGDEPMGREAAYLWVRSLCQDSTVSLQNFLAEACVVVTPVVNADRINVSRLTSSETDLNRNWVTKTSGEIQAAASVLSTHDVVLVVDAHEGGMYTHMQGIGPTADGVPQAVLDQAGRLHTHLGVSFGESTFPWDDYPGGPDVEVARNAIALQEGITTYLFESPSLLASNMYSPTVTWRRDMYLHAYSATFEHFRANLGDYVAAKTAA